VAIPQSFIQDLLNRVDIVEVVGRYVQLKKGGANFMGLCPFHGEKSPSFSVSPTKQFFHCFGCGKNGNAIGFLMEHTGAGFVEAVKDLAHQVGLEVPQDDATPQERAQAKAQRDKSATLNDLLEQASHAYIEQLKQSTRAVGYLKGRGLTGQVAKRFGLGYAPPGWRFLSTVFPNYQDDALVESGMVIASQDDEAPGQDAQEGKRYDRFRDRIMFPIRNVKGLCIGFGGRILDQGEPKYLNSPETPVFSKGHELYGLYEGRTAIRQQGYVLVTEGYMDVVALAQLGFENAVATLGTACTPDHIRLLFRFSDSVVFSFDGDAAGQRAAHKALVAALPWASDTRSIKFLFLPDNHDPDSYIREQGQAAFQKAVEQATPLSRFLLQASQADCDLDTPEGRARMASQARPLWSLMPEGALKRQLLHELADGVGLDSRELDQLWASENKRAKSYAPRSAGGHSGPAGQTAQAGSDAPRESKRRTESPAASMAGMPSSYSPAARPNNKARPTPRNRQGLLGRNDRIARIVLANTQALDWLTHDDHNLLGQEPEPHGPLFAWLEGQWHEHGPQPWAALREGLRGQPFEAACLQLMQADIQPQAGETEADPAEQQHELQELVRRLRIDTLKTRETELIQASSTDPAALERYRAVHAERLELEKNSIRV
jgi:DNA primase